MSEIKKTGQWEPCPQCGSTRVSSKGPMHYVFVGICTIGISTWLLIIPPIGTVGIIIGIGYLLIAPFKKGMLQCDDCRYTWRYGTRPKMQAEKEK